MSALSAPSRIVTPPIVPSTTEPNPRFAELAEESRLARAVSALAERGISAEVVADRSAALERVVALLPPGASVLAVSSQTLAAIGLTPALLRDRGFDPIHPRLGELIAAQKYDEARRLGAAPDAVVGSVHAVTESGQVLVASATGSQLGPYASGAGKVVWVVGTHKVVEDLEEAERRLEEYTFPLENRRAQQAYGQGSTIGKLLIVNREARPGRVHIVFVREPLGY